MKSVTKSFIVFLTIVFALVAIMPAYAQEDLPLGEPLKVGVLGVMTGTAALWGLICKYSTEAYANMINSAGGFVLDGARHMIEVYTADDKLDPKLAVQGAERLIYENGVHYIIGPNVDQTVASILPVIEAEGVIDIGYGQGKELYSPPHYNSIIGMAIGIQSAPVMYQYLMDNHDVKTISFLTRNDPSPLGEREEAIAVAKELGLDILSSDVVYEAETSDFFSILANVLKNPPDLLELAGVSSSDAPLIAKTARQLGYKGFFTTECSLDIGTMVEVAGEYAEGFIYCGGGSAEEIRSDYMKEFVKEYIKIAGEWNDEAGTKVYALPMIVFTIQQAGTSEAFTNVELFKEAMGSLDIPDPFIKEELGKKLRWVGEKYFGHKRQVGVPLVITQVQNGKDVPLFIGSLD